MVIVVILIIIYIRIRNGQEIDEEDPRYKTKKKDDEYFLTINTFEEKDTEGVWTVKATNKAGESQADILVRIKCKLYSYPLQLITVSVQS